MNARFRALLVLALLGFAAPALAQQHTDPLPERTSPNLPHGVHYPLPPGTMALPQVPAAPPAFSLDTSVRVTTKPVALGVAFVECAILAAAIAAGIAGPLRRKP